MGVSRNCPDRAPKSGAPATAHPAAAAGGAFADRPISGGICARQLPQPRGGRSRGAGSAGRRLAMADPNPNTPAPTRLRGARLSLVTALEGGLDRADHTRERTGHRLC